MCDWDTEAEQKQQISALLIHGQKSSFHFHLSTLTLLLTWDTQAPVVVAHTAAHSVGTGVQGTEVDQLSTGRASEACWAATTKAQGTSVARAVIVTRVGGTLVHYLLTGIRLIA